MTGRLGIVGATGWLGQGLCLNLLDKEICRAGDLVLLNRSGPTGAYARHPGVVWANDMSHMLQLCDTVVLSVRPEDFPPKGFVPDRQLLISFMAVITMDRLRALAPQARLVRAMPNGGATTGTSYTPWLAEALDGPDISLTRNILSAIGTEDQIETEDQLDILTAISGSGAAYPALMAQALLTAARTFGLPEKVAERSVEAIVCGSAPILKGRVGEAGALIETYKSYRGITAAGLDAAGAAGFEQALNAAITAAVARARSLGR